MFTIERHKGIMDLINNKKAVTVTELSKHFYIGESTIRRDLEKLAKAGLIRRTYGGAVLLEGLASEIPLSVREAEQRDAKDAIGQMAASLVDDGNIIVMDSSSTVLRMVPYLKGKSNLTVITNGAKTALDLGEHLSIKIYCTGGLLRENSMSYIGELARRSIENFYVDTLFFSCRAISMERGLTDVSEEEAELRRLMIGSCRKKVLLCDSTKFDKITFSKICDMDKIDCIITDKRPSARWTDYLSERNAELICT